MDRYHLPWVSTFTWDQLSTHWILLGDGVHGVTNLGPLNWTWRREGGKELIGKGNVAPIFGFVLACMEWSGLEKEPLLVFQIFCCSFNFWGLFESFEEFHTKASPRFLESSGWVYKFGHQFTELLNFLPGDCWQGVNYSWRWIYNSFLLPIWRTFCHFWACL